MRFAEFQKMNIMLDIIEEGYAPPNPKTKHFERFCRKIIASWLAVGKCFDSCEVIYYLNEN